MAPKEHSLIAPHLSKKLRTQYLRALPGDYLHKFESVFATVQRFESDPHILAQKGDFRESDLDHEIGMLNIVTDVEHTYPYLSRELDLTVVRFFVVEHDIGEIITKDYPAVGIYRNTPEAQRAKRLEEYCAIMILRNIPDSELRAHAIQLFKRYEKQECAESRFVKLIDSIQGNQTVIRHILNYKDQGMDKPEPWMDMHVKQSLQKTVDRALNLRSMLSHRAQEDLDTLLKENIQEYSAKGYTDRAIEAISVYERDIFPNSGLIMQYEQT